jgi:hypothetical protein
MLDKMEKELRGKDINFFKSDLLVHKKNKNGINKYTIKYDLIETIYGININKIFKSFSLFLFFKFK